jgi:2-alkenal reductase
MTRLRQNPIFLFITILLLASLACQAAQSSDSSSVSQDEIVRSVVATVQAQAPTPVAVTNVATGGDTAVISTDLEQSLTQLYQRVNPAVVHIFAFDSQGVFLNSGSGFVYDSDGHIVTNNHVVADATSLEVTFFDGTLLEAVKTGTDVDSDLAVIKVESLPAQTQPIPVGDSSLVQPGQFVIAIGNPFGESGSMSIGIISGLGRTLESQRIADGGGRYSLPQVLQTDAAINPGNSGGPLLNLRGEVIGVNSAILTETGTNSGVGFSIPSNAVSRIAPSLIAEGKYTYPYIGISMRNITSLELLAQLDLPQVQGTYVTEVLPGSPANEAGLIGAGVNQATFEPFVGSDFILAVNGQSIKNSNDLISYLTFETEVGDTIELTVWRDGEEVVVPLTLGERP